MLSKDWHWLKEKGVDLNPCNSPLHPAVLAGAIEVAQGQTMASIQEACGSLVLELSSASHMSFSDRQVAAQTPHIAPALAVVSVTWSAHSHWRAWSSG